MPFRTSFDCLWCGTGHTCRGHDDIEGWAQLCPECVGKAGDNGFLRFRLRRAITERGAAATPSRTTDLADPAPDVDPDDWIQRRGAYSQGPIHDAAWHAEIDAAGRWLDSLPIGGEIVELAAGTGWWSPLLAGKGDLSVYDADATLLDRARDRLLAHRLRAHIHVRDPYVEPDRAVDTVFTAFLCRRVSNDDLDPFLAIVRRWLRPGGTYAFIDEVTESGPTPAELEAALGRAGLTSTEVTTTGRLLLLGLGRA